MFTTYPINLYAETATATQSTENFKDTPSAERPVNNNTIEKQPETTNSNKKPPKPAGFFNVSLWNPYQLMGLHFHNGGVMLNLLYKKEKTPKGALGLTKENKWRHIKGLELSLLNIGGIPKYSELLSSTTLLNIKGVVVDISRHDDSGTIAFLEENDLNNGLNNSLNDGLNNGLNNGPLAVNGRKIDSQKDVSKITSIEGLMKQRESAVDKTLEENLPGTNKKEKKKSKKKPVKISVNVETANKTTPINPYSVDITGVQFGLILNQARAITGAQIGAIYNNSSKVTGLQLGGFWNSTAQLTGLQFGGAFINSTNGTVKGVQFGGLINTSTNTSKWVQAGLFLNSNSGSFTGLEIAPINNGIGPIKGVQFGLLNDSDTTLGLQVGLANSSLKTLKGMQFGGINVATEIIGVQLGFFNYCTAINGLQIGLINVIKSQPFPYFPIPFFPIVNGNFNYKGKNLPFFIKPKVTPPETKEQVKP